MAGLAEERVDIEELERLFTQAMASHEQAPDCPLPSIGAIEAVLRLWQEADEMGDEARVSWARSRFVERRTRVEARFPDRMDEVDLAWILAVGFGEDLPRVMEMLEQWRQRKVWPVQRFAKGLLAEMFLADI